MTEQNGSRSPAPETPPSGPRRSRRGWIIVGSAVGALALLAGALTAVEAHGGYGHGGRMSAEAFAEHLEDHVKEVLSEVDATPEQEAQVTSILQSAATDVRTLKDQHVAMAARDPCPRQPSIAPARRPCGPINFAWPMRHRSASSMALPMRRRS
jgi:hypothetical protein